MSSEAMSPDLSALLSTSIKLVGEDLDDLISRVSSTELSREARLLLLVKALKSTDADRAVIVGALAISRLIETGETAP